MEYTDFFSWDLRYYVIDLCVFNKHKSIYYQSIIFYKYYAIGLHDNIHNNYYRDMFGGIQEPMQSRTEIIWVHKGIIQTLGRHLKEIAVTCGAQN